MAIKTKEELLQTLSVFLGDNDSDEALAFMTDLSDTLGDDSNAQKVIELEAELANKDKEWRKKYKDAFFNKPPKDEFDGEGEEKTPRSFEDLFTTK